MNKKYIKSKIKKIMPDIFKKYIINKKIKNKIKQYTKYKKYCIKNNIKEYVIFNTPIHGNIGDQAIIYAEEKFLEKMNIKPFEVPTYEEKYYFEHIKNNVSKDAIICITGGGFMGSQWFSEEKLIRKVILNFPNHKIIIFPQTIFYKADKFGIKEFENSKEIYNSHKNLHICAREKVSYGIMKEAYENVDIVFVPDIVLFLDEYNTELKREGILLCLRNDVEKNISDKEKDLIIKVSNKYFNKVNFTDTVINGKITNKKREKIINKKLLEFQKSKIVVTDRLHGMIFAAITNTPCIVLGNYNHKVKGVYEWIKEIKYIIYVESVEDVEEKINQLLKEKQKKAYIKINKYFEKIKKIFNQEGNCG